MIAMRRCYACLLYTSCIQISSEYFLCFLRRRHRAHSGFPWYTGGFRRNGWSSADSGWYNPDILQVCYQKLMHWSRRWKASLSDSQLHDVLLRLSLIHILRREYHICDCEVIDLSLMMIVENFGGASLGILAGSAVIRMFYEILNYVSSF